MLLLNLNSYGFFKGVELDIPGPVQWFEDVELTSTYWICGVQHRFNWKLDGTTDPILRKLCHKDLRCWAVVVAVLSSQFVLVIKTGESHDIPHTSGFLVILAGLRPDFCHCAWMMLYASCSLAEAMS